DMSGAFLFFFSSRRRHTSFSRDWSSDVCSSDLRERAKAARKGGGVASDDAAAEYQRILNEHGPTVFTGREEDTSTATVLAVVGRSEERRIGKECRSRWSPEHEKKTRNSREREAK